ncbi:unnamed protein product [Durusdinium trenchii]|uniref:Uncharacterized protein n=1 Tax=Durusdinium trenchii TaxID=1381693 RepID=A0ABP0HUP3_9DINO
MTLLPTSPKGYRSPKDEELGGNESSEMSSEDSDSSESSQSTVCRRMDDEKGSDTEDDYARLLRTRLWRREVIERNIKFGAAIILIENICLSVQTLGAIIKKQPWASYVPYLITYAVEWPVLLFVIKSPRLWLYLTILGFDAITSLIAADPMTISDRPIEDQKGYAILYFNMIYILMSVPALD